MPPPQRHRESNVMCSALGRGPARPRWICCIRVVAMPCQRGDTTLAIAHLTALTDHAPDFAEGYHARAQAYFAAGLYGPAIDDLETTLALNPQQYNAIFGLGAILQEFGDLRAAADLYRRVLSINPHHDNAQRALDGLRRDGIGRTL
ncbi:hypothetical protein Sulfitobl28_24710 [Sulfitobacter pontiacus]|nr:hypothetical protein Sulfitobl28_24710 [Sulfitobacter pontiacus]